MYFACCWLCLVQSDSSARSRSPAGAPFQAPQLKRQTQLCKNGLALPRSIGGELKIQILVLSPKLRWWTTLQPIHWTTIHMSPPIQSRYLSIYIYLYLSIYLSIYLFYLSIYLSIHLSIHPSIQSIHLQYLYISMICTVIYIYILILVGYIIDIPIMAHNVFQWPKRISLRSQIP